jgi:small subunit ribosomal protein S1
MIPDDPITPDPTPGTPAESTLPAGTPVPAPADPDDEAATSAEFARTLQEFEHERRSAAQAAGAATEITVGMKLKGKVVSVGDEHVLVDFGGRSEAVAETRHFRAEDGSVKVGPGDPVELFVVEAGEQVVLAPSIRADAHAALRQMREAHAAGVPVSGRVASVNSGGIEVDLSGTRAFCPLSQIEAGFCADPSVYIGRTLEFIVTSVGETKGSVVLSRRQLLRRGEEEQAKRLLAALKVGDELDGTVVRLEAFGAFVDLGGVDGMVHVSEIRHERVAHPDQVLKAGEKVRVKVLRLDAGKDGRQRIALSIKATSPDPWDGIEQRYAAGARVLGVVARLTDFGAFITLEPGIDGLIHVSEAAPQRIEHVKEVLQPGQTVEALVLGVDAEKKRISLSLKRAVEGFVEEPADGPGAGRARSAGPPRPRAAREYPGAPRSSAERGRPAAPRGRGSVQVFQPPAAPGAEPELTTMAIALRAAMERAKKKEEGGRS